MRFFIYLCIGLLCWFCIVLPCHAEVTVSDAITTDTVWSAEEGPYHIVQDIAVGEGASLSITAGTVVELDAGVNLSVYGKLSIGGTQEKHVILQGYKTSEEDEDSDPASWGGIAIFDQSDFAISYTNISDMSGSFFLKNVDGHISRTILSGGEGFSMESSHVRIDSSTVQDTVRGISAYSQSTLSLSDVDIKNAAQESLSVFNGSSLTANNLRIQTTGKDGCLIFNQSTGDISDSMFEGGRDDSSMSGNGVQVFNESSISIKTTRITGWPDSGITAFGEKTDMNISRSDIYGNGLGVSVYATAQKTHLRKNKIHENTTGVEMYGEGTVSAEKNWWGDPSGPFNETHNQEGLGNPITDAVLFQPWFPDEEMRERDPVIIVPGITGTELSEDFGDKKKLWLAVGRIISSLSDSFLEELALLPTGTPDRALPTTVGDIIRSVSVADISTTHVFDGLLTQLQKEGYVEGVDLFVFPYDWRIALSESATTLKEKIADVQYQTGATKVDIIAHSMGGLVVKKYIADTGPSSIDQLFFIGTPHLGAPKAFKTLMFGDDMDMSLFGTISLLRKKTVKHISQNMPSMYALLPSRVYVSDYGKKYVIDEKENKRALGYADTAKMMVQSGRNEMLVDGAEALHDQIDGVDLSHIRTYNFSGCGTKTIKSITFFQKVTNILGLPIVKDDYFLGYTNGDSTVPLISSDALLTGAHYYINETSHGSLPSAPNVPETISALLRGDTPLSSATVSSDMAFCRVAGTIVSTHSPISLDIYDAEGNHTGPHEFGGVEYGIAGVQYDKIDDATFVFLPEGKEYSLFGHATAIGEYDIYISTIDADDVETPRVHLQKVPLPTLNATARVTIGSVDDTPVVYMDDDGTGDFQKIEQPVVEAPVSEDSGQDNDNSEPSSTQGREDSDSGSIPVGISSVDSTDDNSGDDGSSGGSVVATTVVRRNSRPLLSLPPQSIPFVQNIASTQNVSSSQTEAYLSPTAQKTMKPFSFGSSVALLLPQKVKNTPEKSVPLISMHNNQTLSLEALVSASDIPTEHFTNNDRGVYLMHMMKNQNVYVSIAIIIIAIVLGYWLVQRKVASPDTSSNTSTSDTTGQQQPQNIAVGLSCANTKTLSVTFHLADDTVDVPVGPTGTIVRLHRTDSPVETNAMYTNDDKSILFGNEGEAAFLSENGTRTYESCSISSVVPDTVAGSSDTSGQSNTVGQ